MMLLSKCATEYHYKSRSVCNLEGLMTSKSRYTVYFLTYVATLSARRHLDSEYQSFSFGICQLSPRSPAASWGFKLRLQLRLLYTSSSSEVCLRADVSYFLNLLHAEKVPFPRATKEIGDVCTQAKAKWASRERLRCSLSRDSLYSPK